MKLLYLINVPWGWIKQRPHFLAEYLAEYYDVTVLDQKFLNNYIKKNRKLVRNEAKETDSFRIRTYKTVSFRSIPLINKTKLEDATNTLLAKIQLKNEIRDYDIILFGSPLLYMRFKQIIPKTTKVIYDCMDDHLEFPSIKKDLKRRKFICQKEIELLHRADLVLFSSNYLSNKVKMRSMFKGKSLLINNAIELPSDSPKMSSVAKELVRTNKPFVYIGTISTWLDFKKLVALLNDNQEITIVLIGPKSCDIPNHPRLLYKGPITHEEVFDVMKSSYALIMPFIVNELIEAVNPVKLYEYIYSGKPVISVRYGETEQFAEYVNLYTSYQELDKIVKDIVSDRVGQKSVEECVSFVKGNTWNCRCEQISKALSVLFNN